MKFIFS